MKRRLVIEFDPEARRWSAVFPELPGCASAGDTEEEAVANAKEALALWFEPADVPLEDVLVDRLAGPFEPLETDWKERVRQSVTN